MGISGGQAGTQLLKNIQGDLVEWDLNDELRAYYEQHVDQEKLILLGPCFKTPDSGNTKVEEHDAVIISKNDKIAICIESKNSLNASANKSAVAQLSGMKKVLENYFGPNFTSGEWRYVSVLHYVKNVTGRNICSTCEQFIVKPGELSAKLEHIEDLVKQERPTCTPDHVEYQNIVAGLAFSVLAVGQPLATRSRIVQEMAKKVTGTAKAMGQGDYQSVMFWSPLQARLMTDDSLQMVFFHSFWGDRQDSLHGDEGQAESRDVSC